MPKVFSINVEKIGRMPFFDFLKMFAMFMVLWGHCIQHLQTGEVWNEPMHNPLVSFILMKVFTYMTKRIQVYKNISFWLLGKSKN